MAIPRKEDKAITDKDFHNFFFFKFCLKKFLSNMYLWSQFPIHLQTSKLVLSYKLWCYTRISSPEKSPNNSRKKIRYSSSTFDIANQLLTRYSLFAPLGQVDE